MFNMKLLGRWALFYAIIICGPKFLPLCFLTLGATGDSVDRIQQVCESGCCLRLESLEAESEMRILAWAINGASALRSKGK